LRTLKLTICYDGSDYAGWQAQPDQPTIQGLLEKAFAQVTGEQRTAVGSGRTDAGVHALGQVVSIDTESSLPAERLLRALNAHLPDDIAVLSIDDARPGFHAIRDAVRKRYRYLIHDGSVRDVFSRRYAWHYRQRLDDRAMQQGAQHLLGTHDFRSFESHWPNRESSIRTVHELTVERSASQPDQVRVEIEADGFLYNMVRAIVGTLVEVGRGARPVAWPGEVLAALDRSAAGVTAPAHGLFLVQVWYAEGSCAPAARQVVPHERGR
jgi:tRNA pseudouridine38-40 synthase